MSRSKSVLAVLALGAVALASWFSDADALLRRGAGALDSSLTIIFGEYGDDQGVLTQNGNGTYDLTINQLAPNQTLDCDFSMDPSTQPFIHTTCVADLVCPDLVQGNCTGNPPTQSYVGTCTEGSDTGCDGTVTVNLPDGTTHTIYYDGAVPQDGNCRDAYPKESGVQDPLKQEVFAKVANVYFRGDKFCSGPRQGSTQTIRSKGSTTDPSSQLTANGRITAPAIDGIEGTCFPFPVQDESSCNDGGVGTIQAAIADILAASGADDISSQLNPNDWDCGVNHDGVQLPAKQVSLQGGEFVRIQCATCVGNKSTLNQNVFLARHINGAEYAAWCQASPK